MRKHSFVAKAGLIPVSYTHLERPAAEMKLNGLGIRMDHVSFAYRQEDGEVLHDVNLDIQPGTVTEMCIRDSSPGCAWAGSSC